MRYNSLSGESGKQKHTGKYGQPFGSTKSEQHDSSVGYALGLFIKRVLGERGAVSEDNCVFICTI